MHTVFPLGLHLDQHFVLPHDLDHLSDITSRFVQELKLLS